MHRSVLAHTREYASEIPEYGVFTGQLRLPTISLSYSQKREKMQRDRAVFDAAAAACPRRLEAIPSLLRHDVLLLHDGRRCLRRRCVRCLPRRRLEALPIATPPAHFELHILLEARSISVRRP